MRNQVTQIKSGMGSIRARWRDTYGKRDKLSRNQGRVIDGDGDVGEMCIYVQPCVERVCPFNLDICTYGVGPASQLPTRSGPCHRLPGLLASPEYADTNSKRFYCL